MDEPNVSFEERQRLAPSRGGAILPHWGLLFSAIFGVLLLPTAILQHLNHLTPKGIYVSLSSTHFAKAKASLSMPPIIVSVQWRGSARFLLNGTEVRREDLGPALKAELSRRPEWIVFVEGAGELDVSEVMYAVDVIHDLHATSVLLTPAMKQSIPDGKPRPR